MRRTQSVHFALMLLFVLLFGFSIAESNVSPVADPNGPCSGCVGEPIQFYEHSSIDSGWDSLTYNWHLGDGNMCSGVSLTHTYLVPATYPVDLPLSYRHRACLRESAPSSRPRIRYRPFGKDLDGN